MGIPEGRAITLSDLERYGRKTIDVSLQGEGIYYFDFSVENDRRQPVANLKNRRYTFKRQNLSMVAEPPDRFNDKDLE